jgi:guanylate kinase
MSSERARRGLLLVVSSPSGAGKTSLSRRLVADNPSLDLSISVTTRAPRPGEAHGREYDFVDRAVFDSMVDENAFMEWAEVHEHRYGTPGVPVVLAVSAGQDVLFDIDWQGAAAIAAAAPEEVVRVFILPPSMADLARRLHARAQDAEDVIERRLQRAYGEIEHWTEYDYVIVNEDFDAAYAELAHIYRAERLKRARNPGLAPFVAGLLAEQL